MAARLFAFVTWALVAASVAMWASRLFAQRVPLPAHAEVVGPAAVPAAPLVRLFGAPPPAPAVQAAEPPPLAVKTQFRLLGVVAPRPGQRNGLALIATDDDRPPRAVPLGGKVDDSMVVLAIRHRQVDIGPRGGPTAVSLNLPAAPEPARGVPTSAAVRPGMAPMRVPPAGGVPQPLPQVTPMQVQPTPVPQDVANVPPPIEPPRSLVPGGPSIVAPGAVQR